MSKDAWSVRRFIFRWEGKERGAGRQHKDIKTDELLLTHNQKQTWSVIQIDGLSRNCRQVRTL